MVQWPVTSADLEAIFDFPVNISSTYQEAFVHKSAVKVTNTDSYERLEFLGDSVISLAVNDYLFHEYPQQREGFMTRLKTKLVSGTCLAELAAKLNLQKHIMMNKKALDEGWSANPKIMEDCLEALIGALYLDRGHAISKAFVVSLLDRHINFNNLRSAYNPKDSLMMFCQQQKVDLPEYRMIDVPYPTKSPCPILVKFAIETHVDGTCVGIGTGPTKKDAEQMSAHVALENLGVPQQANKAFVM